MPTDYWNKVYTSADPMIPIEVGQVFSDAFWERYQAVYYDPTSIGMWGWPPPTITKNDHFQVGNGNNFFGFAAMQAQLETFISPGGGLGVWIYSDGAADFTGLAELPIWEWDSGKPHSIVDTVLGGHGWTRKYHKEYISDHPDVYVFSRFSNNAPPPVTDGDTARCLDDGKVYRRQGGAWVLAPAGAIVDVVTDYGQILTGDLIGPWILNELRDVMKKLKWWAPSAHNGQWVGDGVTVNHKRGSTGWTNQTSWADAWQSAQADYDASGEAIDGSIVVTPQAYSRGGNDPGAGTWGAEMERAMFKLRLETTGSSWSWFAAGVPYFARAIDFYSIGQNTADPNLVVFDANGDPVLNGLWKKWDTQAATVGQSVVISNWLGSMVNRPNWCVDPSTVGGQVALGWDLWGGAGIWAHARPVIRYDVAGGFKYQ